MGENRITTRDGTGIALHSSGTGPGIVVVHGGGVTIEEYRRLAAALADRFTVHLYNRRGRAEAAPKHATYTVDEDIDDLAAVLQHTGARNALGHSYGGFVVLRAALRLPLERIALYDPTVSLSGGFPTAFLDEFEEAIQAGNQARALAVMSRGLRSAGPLSSLPLGVQTAISQAFLRTRIGRTMGDLLPTTLLEARQVQAHDGPAEDYAGIASDVLLATGAWSPPYYREVNDALARVIKKAQTERLPRSAHDAINIARAQFIKPFASFFAAPLQPN
jgi:pimeloyl-ACP methyl ester carboxylesterase